MEQSSVAYTLISDLGTLLDAGLMPDDRDATSLQEKQLKADLEGGKDSVKIAAMKAVLAQMLRGESLNGILMHVIRFVMPSKNKQLKKFNALRNDLLHPNEFIRGQSLRFLCKLKEADILEPLIPSVRQCLEHKHPYVRKNAVLAIFSIFKIHQYLIPDATELIQTYMNTENDQGAKRNAMLMLMNTSLPLAVAYYNSVVLQIPTLDQSLQLVFIEMIRKDGRSPTADKAKYIQTVISLLSVPTPSVRYEAANTLVYLSSHRSAIQAAVACYIDLAIKESDNNVKLIVLNRIDELRKKNDRMLDEVVMDILRVVTSPDLLVRKRSLEIAMDLVSSRNVDEVILFLKKELVKTHDQEYEKTTEYRQLLIHAIHGCAIKFPQVADSVVHVLMDFLTDSNKVSAVDVIAFVKEVVERFPHLRSTITSSLLDAFPDMKTGRTIRGALWIIGEYALETELMEACMSQILACIGPIPIVSEQSDTDAGPAANGTPKSPTHPSGPRRVLADGTYASESAFSAVRSPIATNGPHHRAPLKALVYAGDFYAMTILATTLTKLSLRYEQECRQPEKVNSFKTQAMLIITSIIRAGKSSLVTAAMDEDSYSRMITCLRVLSSIPPEKAMLQTFLADGRAYFTKMIAAKDVSGAMANALQKAAGKGDQKTFKAQVDDVVSFRLLKGKKDGEVGTDQDFTDLSRATGAGDDEEVYVSKLDRIHPLTGYSDPIYAEAYIHVHHFDIVMEILIINQTKETLQNLTIEFSALGDLKLVEKPTPHTIGPHGFHSVKVNFKVSSTESGIIFGNLVYDTTAKNDFNSVLLNDIHVDIMDYIKPKHCNEQQFRSMWDEFEWENRINAQTSIKDLKQYLQFILDTTNMKCLTPERALEGECGFLAANLYAQSIFGEDALANICLELTNNVIQGHIRIRSKTQGIALALGEKVRDRG
ncbi:coatomer subunit beta [Kappamyces sp. JEL0829]|nr:coatomer subunit beta [Kappamyces sp. JEL0829]